MLRESYREELDDINACLVEMANSVGSAMSTATTALLDADVALADLVIAGDERIDAVRESIEERCFTLLARQQPVATDLRVITTAMRIVADLERMGDLAEHIAEAIPGLHGFVGGKWLAYHGGLALAAGGTVGRAGLAYDVALLALTRLR